MKLHTDFRDYYDTAVGYGIDDKIHYNRFTKEAEIRLNSKLDLPSHFDAGLLGFCGRIYPFIEFRKFDRNQLETHAGGWQTYKVVERYYAYDLDDYRRREIEWKDDSSVGDYLDRSREIKLKRFFIDWHFESDEIFLEQQAPVWTTEVNAYRHRGLLNPRLKDYGFDRIKDAVTAFQEISMYLANILVEQKEPATVEDKLRIERHGFDSKKSFRKPSG